MTTQITDGVSSITPTDVTVYSSTRTPQTIVHIIPGNPDPAVTLSDANLRSGSITLLFDNDSGTADTDSSGAETLLKLGNLFTLTDTTYPSINMQFVISGNVDRALDFDYGNWTVAFDYTEVS